jgi:hypothetical protein
MLVNDNNKSTWISGEKFEYKPILMLYVSFVIKK